MGLTHVRALIFASFVAIPVAAHEIGTMQVHAVFRKDHTYSIRIAGTRVRPEACEMRFDGLRVRALSGEIPQGARTFTWRYSRAYATYALTLENEGSQPLRQWIEGDAPSAPFALRGTGFSPSVARQYFLLGFTHIVPHGLDHILFVLGLFLLSTKWKPVLMQVTSFTVAHSITLALTIYGIVSVSPRIVEPMIALSIAYVAIENLTTSQLRAWRVAIVFAFGLLHGMGFAGVLKELALPRSEFLTALVTFNIGVEAGQLAVIAVAFLLVAWWAHARPWYRRRLVVPASALIAATGLFWTIQRVAL